MGGFLQGWIRVRTYRPSGQSHLDQAAAAGGGGGAGSGDPQILLAVAGADQGPGLATHHGAAVLHLRFLNSGE